MFRIEALPAGNGDALLLEWGPSSTEIHQMLIDGGVGSTYATLHKRLLRLPTDAKGRRPIDLLVITHIDNDHIEGIIRLLCDPDVRLAPADVWFNGWPQVRRPGSGDLGAKEGEWLGALLERGRLPWNKAFAQAARRRVQVPTTGRLPRRTVAGLELVVLSPEPAQLDELRDTWDAAVRAAGGVPGDVDAAIRQLEETGALVPAILGDADDSVTNGSSIAFTATYGGRCALLTGDAHRDTVADSLGRLAKEAKVGGPVPVDVFKLCHHGSIHNIDGALLAAMSCQRFLISTNGARHKHPNASTIDLIINTVNDAELIFNYRSPTTMPWSKKADQRDRHYRATYPTAGAMIVDV
jgi:hypothetical protein